MRISRAAVAAAALATGVLAAGRPVFGPWGVTLSYMDTSVPPGTDFFRYANGAWLKGAAIPPDRRLAGVNLELDQGNESKLRTVVERLRAKPESALSAEERKLRDFYAAFVDTRAIEAAGLAPVRADLDRIAALQDATDVAAFMGNATSGTYGPFSVYISIDQGNPAAYTVRLMQSGLGLPDRDYYLRTDKDLAATRAEYRRYLAAMLAVAGIRDAQRAEAVLGLETRLAQAHWSAAERRDAEKTYNPMSLSQLVQLAPRFPWAAFLGARGIPLRSPAGERQVDVGEKSAFPRLAEVFADTPVPVWRDYLTVRYLHRHAHYLPREIDERDFAFYGTVLSGQKQQLPREVRAIRMLDEEMGEALGKLYCAAYFPPEAKARSQALVANMIRAYEIDIQALPWMSPATKQQALEKVRSFQLKIGYPDTWRDYSALLIRPGELITDIHNAEAFEWHRQVARLDAPVDRGEWFMTAPTNNAYYDPNLNEIAFPAGVLQPPYFDPGADDAANYGAIGATIGHEMSHAFDDQGSKYDAAGRLHNWWTPEDRRNFDARTARLAQQYDRYQALPGLHLNGRLTLGENIADLAGLVIAGKAYHLALGDRPAPLIGGLTGEQRFYIAYGQSWREIWSDGLTRRIALSDEHSPAEFRVNGVVRNDAGWYAAFPQVKPGAALYLAPEERVLLW
ncbi:MAG: M13 family metallopeptidase [Proteobacteria bacterium]|nr:M13 family metallopeptidase [Pseudomonadota bacterium]